MKNTLFSYMYRDSSNNKSGSCIIFQGEPTPELEARLKAAFDDGKFFIAHQIGVPEVFLWDPSIIYDPEDKATYPKGGLSAGKYCIAEDADHSWHEFTGLSTTGYDSEAPDARTIEQFVQQVESAAKEGWKEFEPISRRTVAAS